MTLKCYNVEFNFLEVSRNFAELEGNNGWVKGMKTRTVSERIVAHVGYFSAMYRLRWYCWAFLR